jgi:hypothetical protein
VTHVQLAGGGGFLWAMRHAVNHHRTSAANAFTAIMIKCNRIFAFVNELFVYHVQHFKKRHMLIGFRFVSFKTAFFILPGLAPNF